MAWRTGEPVSSNTFRLAVVSVAVALAAGCGGVNERKSIDSARARLDKGEYTSAVIELKSVLQANPNSGEARFLLGRALLGTGDAASAAVELGKAADLKYDNPMLAVEQARAALRQGQHKEVIERFAQAAVAHPRAKAEMDTVVATAMASAGRVDDAKKLLASALAAAPDLREALMLQVRFIAVDGDIAGAVSKLDELIKLNGKDALAWLLKGDLLLVTTDRQAAAADAYRQAIALDKELAAAHVGLIQTHLRANDSAAAQAAQEAMAKVMPNNAHARFYGAQIAYLRGDLDAAQQAGQVLLKAFPEDVRVLQLVGLIDLKRRALVPAETYLRRALQIAPESAWTRRLLGQTYVALGQAPQALEILRPVIESSAADADAFEVAAEASLQLGDFRTAEALYVRAAQRNPNEIRLKTTLAVTRLVKGDSAGGFRELEALAAANPKSDVPDLALIAGRLRRNEIDAALQAIDALERKRPDQPLTFALRGRAQMMRADLPAARRSFERALEVQPDYFPAAATLAGLDLAEKKPQQAAQRFEALLKRNPKNYPAQVALADVKGRSGAPAAEVVALFAEAIKSQPGQAHARLMLHTYLLRQRDTNQALQVAQDGVAALPNHPDMLDALARTQLAIGDSFQAINSFRKVIALVPNSAEAHMRLADAYVARKDFESAVSSLRKALDIAPDLESARRGLANLALRQNRYPEALAVAREMQKRAPASGLGYLFEADIESVRKNWDAAAAAYRQGLAKAPLPEMAPKLHALLVRNGKLAEADRFKAEWQTKRPNDSTFLFYLAQEEFIKRNFAAAAPMFEQVLKLDPANVIALNNLAWLKVELKMPGAVELAEKANVLRPDSPAVLDTLALALEAEGKLDRAMQLEKRALEILPGGHQYRLNLARMQIAAGDKAGARAHLEQLSKLGDKFAGQQQVNALLDKTKP